MRMLLILLLNLPLCGAVIEVSPGENIQDAVNGSAPLDTIMLLNGEYYESVLVNSNPITICGEFILTNDTTDISRTIWRPGENRPDTASCVVVADIQGIPTLLGITFMGGQGTIGRDTNEPAGGAILVERSNLKIDYCLIKNSESTYGGGVASFGGNLWSPQGHLQVYNCTFDSCTSFGWGGGLYANTCSLSVEQTKFEADSALGDGGGLIALDCISSVSGCEVLCCTGGTGGAVFAGRSSRVANCAFENNKSLPPTYWATHYAHGQGHHVVEGCYFGQSASLSRGFNFCCGGDTIVFVGNIVENIVATSPFGTGNFAISGVRGELAYNIVRNNRTRGEQIFPLGGTTIDIHHNIFSGNVSDFADRPSVLKIGQDPDQTFHDNAIVGNSGQTIGYTADPGLIDARYNWWGSETGPYHPTRNPFGQGDTILSDSVLFDPWLLSPPDTTNSISPPQVTQPSTWKIVSLYPNPFNSELSIAIAGVMSPTFSLKLYDLLGREVATLSEGRGHGAMIHYTASPTLATGVYFVRAADATSIETRKIVFLK
jgi:hypothetical protein